VEIKDKFFLKMVHKCKPLGIGIKIQKNNVEKKILQEIMPKTKKKQRKTRNKNKPG